MNKSISKKTKIFIDEGFGRFIQGAIGAIATKGFYGYGVEYDRSRRISLKIVPQLL